MSNITNINNQSFERYKVLNLKLERKLEHQYEAWQDIIDNAVAHLNSLFEFHETAETTKANKIKFENEIKKARKELVLEENVSEKYLRPLREELNQLKVELNEKINNFCNQLNHQLVIVMQRIDEMPDSPEVDLYDSDDEKLKGLNPQRIKKFEEFSAVESFVGGQCTICIGDFEIGRNMMRLDCDGQHTFCQVCLQRMVVHICKGWFADHNTCPICRHKFKCRQF